MNDQPQQTNPKEHKYYPDDEIELMDYLLVIWKWKYIILAGTLVVTLAAAIISFIAWKQQSTMYRTDMVLKSGVLQIGETDNNIFIDTAENIKILLENNIKFRILDDIKSSNNKNMSTALNYQVGIPLKSDKIHVTSLNALADEDTTTFNYLIKALLYECANKAKYIFDKEIELKKTLLGSLKEKEMFFLAKIKNSIELKKYEFKKLALKEIILKNKIEKYQQELPVIESKRKLLNDSKGIFSSKELLLKKLSVEHDYLSISQKYFELYENAKYDLFEMQNKISAVANEIEDLVKTKGNIKVDSFLQPNLYKIQNDIIKVAKEIKKLEKGKNSVQDDIIYLKRISKIPKGIAENSKEIKELEMEKQNVRYVQIIKPPVTTELPKTVKIRLNVVLSSATGLFLMLLLSFLLEYISKYKDRKGR